MKFKEKMTDKPLKLHPSIIFFDIG